MVARSVTVALSSCRRHRNTRTWNRAPADGPAVRPRRGPRARGTRPRGSAARQGRRGAGQHPQVAAVIGPASIESVDGPPSSSIAAFSSASRLRSSAFILGPGADGASATALQPRPRRITQFGVSRFPGTTPAMRPPDRLGGRAARGPLPSGTPSTRIRGAGRRTRGPRIRPGGAAPPPGGP